MKAWTTLFIALVAAGCQKGSDPSDHLDQGLEVFLDACHSAPVSNCAIPQLHVFGINGGLVSSLTDATSMTPGLVSALVQQPGNPQIKVDGLCQSLELTCDVPVGSAALVFISTDTPGFCSACVQASSVVLTFGDSKDIPLQIINLRATVQQW